jgi:hypothetical protein
VTEVGGALRGSQQNKAKAQQTTQNTASPNIFKHNFSCKYKNL